MELHAHSHTARKKWTHYLWEFIMLFLAVFCGFLAENKREHYIEHQRERQYIHSLILDVNTDIANISSSNGKYEKICSCCDTLISHFDLFIHAYPLSCHTSFTYILSGYPSFIYTDRTMQQLKNSGALRLIRNLNVSDSIIAYDADIKTALLNEVEVDNFYEKIMDMANGYFNFRKLDKMANNNMPPGGPGITGTGSWLFQDSLEVERLYNLIRKYRRTVFYYNKYLEKLKLGGERLVSFLKKEYHLE